MVYADFQPFLISHYLDPRSGQHERSEASKSLKRARHIVCQMALVTSPSEIRKNIVGKQKEQSESRKNQRHASLLFDTRRLLSVSVSSCVLNLSRPNSLSVFSGTGMNPTAIYWSSFSSGWPKLFVCAALLSHNLEFQPKVTSKPTTIHQHKQQQ